MEPILDSHLFGPYVPRVPVKPFCLGTSSLIEASPYVCRRRNSVRALGLAGKMVLHTLACVPHSKTSARHIPPHGRTQTRVELPLQNELKLLPLEHLQRNPIKPAVNRSAPPAYLSIPLVAWSAPASSSDHAEHPARAVHTSKLLGKPAKKPPRMRSQTALHPSLRRI